MCNHQSFVFCFEVNDFYKIFYLATKFNESLKDWNLGSGVTESPASGVTVSMFGETVCYIYSLDISDDYQLFYCILGVH